jgi:hypothetical protein
MWDLGRLEVNAGREDAAEPITRCMLDLLKDAAPDPATRKQRASRTEPWGDSSRPSVDRGGLALLESSRNTLLDLRSKGYNDKTWQIKLTSASSAWRAKVAAGDLDGALNGLLELVRKPAPTTNRLRRGRCRYVDLSAGVDRRGVLGHRTAQPERAGRGSQVVGTGGSHPGAICRPGPSRPAGATSGQERRDALLKSAAACHSWPATSYTRRDEEKDLAAANK